jgi:putative ABC transport system permease protein
LWRNRARTTFTVLSIAIAFILFGILGGIDAGFAHILNTSRLDRLFVDARFGGLMPLSYAEDIARVPGIETIAPRSWLPAFFQDPKNPVGVLCADRRFFSLRPEIEISKGQLEQWRQIRTGAVVGLFLANRYGWKVGDTIPLQSNTAHADGSRVWTFDIVAIADDLDYPGQSEWFIGNYQYLDEGRAANKGTIDRFLIRIRDPSRSTQIAREIDRMFASSGAPTRTSSERSQTEAGLQYLGDANVLMDTVLGAVFFLLLCMTGNTMMQSIRERVPEFAVLKTLGFTDGAVLWLVVSESVLLCLLAAVVGLLVSKLVIPLTQHALSDFVLLLQMPWTGMLGGLGFALMVALLSAALPAWRVRQLSVVDALVKR